MYQHTHRNSWEKEVNSWTISTHDFQGILELTISFCVIDKFQGRFNDEDYENMISIDIDIGLKFARKAFDIQDAVQFKVITILVKK